MLFYGGSTVESWRGTERGELVERARGIPAMWGRHFGEPYRAAAFGIASAPPPSRPEPSADDSLFSDPFHFPSPMSVPLSVSLSFQVVWSAPVLLS